MKRCPECRRDYNDDSLSFCLDDGSELLFGPASMDEPLTAILSEFGVPPSVGSVSEPGAVATGFLGNESATAILSEFGVPPSGGSLSESATRTEVPQSGQTAILRTEAEAEPQRSLEDLSEKHSFSANWAAKPLAALFVAVLILVGGFFGYKYLSPTKQIESIAVMPFVNQGGNAEVEYLSDGMTETLIRSLSQLANLQVKPRSSVFRYKGKETDAKTIGKELNVEAILSGRVVQRGEQLTLNLELIDVQKDVVLWSEQYIRKQTDLVNLQSEIAKDVSAKLKSKLSGADEANVTKTSTANPEAYQAYLKGRYYWNRRTAENLKKAIEQFKVATDRDPNYALAFAGLADCYVVLTQYAGTPTGETIPQVRVYAERAIALDGQLAEPHASLGVANRQLWQWAESEREFMRAIELNPSYATAYHWYSVLLNFMGRHDEARAMIQRAHELDPLSSVISVNISWSQQIQNDHEASIQTSLKVLEIDPNFAPAYDSLGMSYLKTGRNAEAVAAAEKSVQLSKYGPNLGDLGYVYAMTGKRNEAIAIAKELEKGYAEKKPNSGYIAAVYAGLGDKDKAFEWLEKGFQNKEETGVNRGQVPFESLRDDPRYKDLLKRMNLPE